MTWTPFYRAEYTQDQIATFKRARMAVPDAVYQNNLYEVAVRYLKPDGILALTQLSIKRLDKEPVTDWRHFQWIKNEIVGVEFEFVQLYPAESRLVDTSNQYWLYGFQNPAIRWPFGFQQRCVVDGVGGEGSKQRPFPEHHKPKDAMTDYQANAAMKQVRRIREE